MFLISFSYRLCFIYGIYRTFEINISITIVALTLANIQSMIFCYNLSTHEDITTLSLTDSV
jgi:hypothetical protein